MPKNVQAKVNRTNWYFDDRKAFMLQLCKEIEALVRKAERENLTPVVRLNGSSDIPWERVPIQGDGRNFASAPNLMAMYPDVQFYDYTKRYNRKDLPANYHLTFSMAEDNEHRAYKALGNGMNVAIVFFSVPENFTFGPRSASDNVPVSYTVIDGDASDVRFLDVPGVIVGLKAKGDAVHDTTGFVR
jgi:hypothetical protein